jgi:hypothetical protein
MNRNVVMVIGALILILILAFYLQSALVSQLSPKGASANSPIPDSAPPKQRPIKEQGTPFGTPPSSKPATIH